jgi:hypothetical protein
MKKIMIGILLVFGVCTTVFSLQENWSSLNISFGNYFESGQDMEDMYMGSLGMGLSLYSFFDKKNVGIFVNVGWHFPVTHNLTNGYDPAIQFDLLLGPGFRYSFKQNLKMHFGFGFNFRGFYLYKTESSQVKFSDSRTIFGVGGDIGIRYDITNIINISVGTTLFYDFANNRRMESTADNWKTTVKDSDGWVRNYAMFGISPYIAIGFNYYGETGKYGKPN